MSEIITSTGQWTLVIHRVSTSSVEVWVGTLFPTLKMPDSARVKLVAPDGSVSTRKISRADWQRPFSKVNQRFYALVEFKNLQPATRYQLTFDRKVENYHDVVKEHWQDLRSGTFDTLPARVPLQGSKPFTIAIGSCFYNHRDGGQAAGSYCALYERGDEDVRPDISVLMGDQVYLDIGFDSLSLLSKEIRQRIADDYALHWQALGSILSHGGTWMLPDDHEYWNDYPFYDSLIPTLLALKLHWVRKSWTEAAKDGVANVQRSPRIEVVDMGGDLSICFADLRSHRSETGFLPAADFKQLTGWATQLKQPGVLVIPQPLIDNVGKQERNLLNFPEQYSALLAALAVTGHDIVVLTGDVHYGRVASVELGTNGAQLIEVVSSPLSNLTGLNGIATDTPPRSPDQFPADTDGIAVDWPRRKVSYERGLEVSTRRGRTGSAYPADRTSEHFMTVSFSRDDSGVVMTVNAWRVRERDSKTNLPARDFKQPYTVTLR